MYSFVLVRLILPIFLLSVPVQVTAWRTISEITYNVWDIKPYSLTHSAQFTYYATIIIGHIASVAQHPSIRLSHTGSYFKNERRRKTNCM